MSRRDENENLADSKEAAESPVVQELRRHLAEPGLLQQAQGGLWPQRFRRLAEAIVDAVELSCQECEEGLDVYVDEELRGGDVQQLYPRIWEHLRTCPRCRQSHDLIADTLRLARRGELPPLPGRGVPPPSCLQPQPADAPWITHLQPRTGGAPFGLSVTFSLSYLQSLLAPPAPQPARVGRPVPSSGPLLLLSDTIRMGAQILAVEVTADLPAPQPRQAGRDSETADHLHLQATVAGSAPLPETLWATLVWADQVRSSPVDTQGQARFGSVPLTALQEALETGEGVFRITFETRDE